MISFGGSQSFVADGEAGQPNRLPEGGLVDRARPMRFRFDGRKLVGYRGDTLASALLASGQRLVARSFKYHRPRGILTAGPEEPNALVELRDGARREPNSRATTIELYDGLIANSQNAWPSLRFDMMAVNQIAAPMFVAGFYYKTFMWPARLWESVYEPAIRRAAGLGRAAGAPDPDTYEKSWAHCDVLVVGAGATGLAAALAAGRSGARVILADDDSRLGGRLLSDTEVIDAMAGVEWAQAAEAELRALPNVRIFTRTAITGVFDGGTFSALERVNDHAPTPTDFEPRQRLWRIVAKRAIIATGAIERPIVFGNNDRPGVMMSAAVRSYIQRFAVAPARKLVVFGAHDEAWQTAAAAKAAGLEVHAIVDAREEASGRLNAFAKAHDLTAITGQVIRVEASKHGVSSVGVRGFDRSEQTFEADGLAISGGWNPNVALTCHARGRPTWRDDIAAFVPNGYPGHLTAAGAANGDFDLASCLERGHAAGADAASDAGHSGSAGTIAKADKQPVAAGAFFHVSGAETPAQKAKAFVDFQHDVTRDDIAIAKLEGFTSVEHLKRYTTLGMATDQGRLSNVTGLALMAEVSGRTIAEVGTTIYRPPYAPTAIAALAGRHNAKHFKPTRLTPIHSWSIEQNASFVEAGLWLRPEWYVRDGETQWRQSVDREVKTVRDAVGFCDVSTLGKIDVVGPDAAEFLNRVYANTISTLTVGKCRYGLMLREDGFVMDDGTVARINETHFFVTTTTAKAGLVMQHLDYARQVLWPDLAVNLTSSTDHWAQISVAGPASRDVVQRLIGSAGDVSAEALAFMGYLEVPLKGGPRLRIYRISFSGELAYELAVPARYGAALAQNLMQVGADFGIAPYGTEALNVMRLEKGHVSGGELNGMTTARDLGLGGMMSKKKDFIGRTLAERPALVASDRQVLIGLRAIATQGGKTAGTFKAGAHVFAQTGDLTPANDDGYVTSVCYSPTLGTTIGLAMVRQGRERHGEIARAHDPLRNTTVEVEITSPHFFDPEGARQRG